MKSIKEIKQVPVLQCQRCGHAWITRKLGSMPRKCPFCQSYKWYEKKKNGKS